VTKKKLMLVSVVAAVLSVALLAACGRTSDAPQAGGSQSSGNAEKAHLTFWAMDGDGDNLPKLLDEFEAENPGIKIDVTSIPWQDASAKFRTAIAGGVTPDIAQVGTTLMGGITDSFQTVPSDVDTKEFFPGTLSSAKVSGSLVGVPWVVDPRALFYRTDLAQKAGFSSPPANLDQLDQLAKGMESKGGAKWGIRFSTTPDQELQNALYFPWSNGAQIINSDDTKWTFDTPAAVQAYTAYQNLFKQGLADPTPDAGAGAAESQFVSGQLGMLVAGSGEVQQLEQAGGSGFASKFAVAPFPKGSKSATAFVGGSNLVVFKQSKNSAAAWKLINWLSEPKTQVEWYKIAGGLPAVQSAWSDPLLKNKYLTVFGQQLKDTNSPPPVATWLQVADAFGQQIDQMVKNGKSPEQALKDTQTAADSIGTGK
jgi:multiple sugar transport system substrate-binding protein